MEEVMDRLNKDENKIVFTKREIKNGTNVILQITLIVIINAVGFYLSYSNSTFDHATGKLIFILLSLSIAAITVMKFHGLFKSMKRYQPKQHRK